MEYRFDEKVEQQITKSVKSAQRFYSELRKAAIEKEEPQYPPSFESFVSKAKGLMDSYKQVDMGRLNNASIRDLLERTWSQKLLNYSTQKLLREAYDALLRRF